MKKFSLPLLTIIFSGLFISHSFASQSKRVEVYSISQNYWDVIPGETLGVIVKQLLPDNPGLRNKLLKQIIELNPDAFSQSNPDNLKANVRLWLPNNAPAMRQIKNKKLFTVKSYNWGQVYKPKRD